MERTRAAARRGEGELRWRRFPRRGRRDRASSVEKRVYGVEANGIVEGVLAQGRGEIDERNDGMDGFGS